MSEMYMLDGYLSLVLIKTNQLHPPMQMAEENGNTHFTIHNIVQNLNDLTFFSSYSEPTSTCNPNQQIITTQGLNFPISTNQGHRILILTLEAPPPFFYSGTYPLFSLMKII